MIVSLDWEKPVTPATAGRPALFIVLGAESSRAGLAGTAGCLLSTRPGMWATKRQDPGCKASCDVLQNGVANHGVMLCFALPSLSPLNLSLHPGSYTKSPVTASVYTRL